MNFSYIGVENTATHLNFGWKWR